MAQYRWVTRNQWSYFAPTYNWFLGPLLKLSTTAVFPPKMTVEGLLAKVHILISNWEKPAQLDVYTYIIQTHTHVQYIYIYTNTLYWYTCYICIYNVYQTENSPRSLALGSSWSIQWWSTQHWVCTGCPPVIQDTEAGIDPEISKGERGIL